MKNVYISIFKNYMSREPIGKGELFDFLTTPKFKEWVEKIRVTEDKEKRRKLKSKLYCFTPSGLFSVRKREGLLKHSGYICIDIDRDDNPHIKDFKWLRTELGKINNVAYAGLSVSGIGFFALIPIKYPEKHKEHVYNNRKVYQILLEKYSTILSLQSM